MSAATRVLREQLLAFLGEKRRNDEAAIKPGIYSAPLMAAAETRK